MLTIHYYDMPVWIKAGLPKVERLSRAHNSVFYEEFAWETWDMLGIINIVWKNEAEIRALNKQYRDKDYATDILTFPYETTYDDADVVIGEIFICDTILKEKHATTEDLYAMILTHGLIHMMGYDHETEEEADIMSSLEEQMLAAIHYIT